jgi:gamma-glutamyltranspeptidase/glutathione hydrolase
MMPGTSRHLLRIGLLASLACTNAALAANQLTPNATDAGVRFAGAPHASRSVTVAMHGMAATSHMLASQVAVDILKQGGSAVDAAIAANAMLSFAEPMMCGPGGDLFAIVWDPATKKLHGLNGSGRAARGLSLDALMQKIGKDAKEMPLAGPLTITVPGAVDGWFELHAKFGKLPMREVLAPVIAYAREGVPTPPVIAAEWEGSIDFHHSLKEFAPLHGNLDAQFAPGGRTPATGEVFRNPQLADFLEHLATDGRDWFYTGDGAKRLAAYLQKSGSALTTEDFARHASTWVDPVSTNYRGHDVYEIPPNGQGTAVLQMLNILEGYDLRAMGRANPDFWHVMLEAKKLAYEDRGRYYADPDFMRVSVAQLLDKDYAAEQRKRIDMKTAQKSIPPTRLPNDDGDTTYLSVADGNGMMISLIQSTYDGFGSGLVPDGFGFALQNRGNAFSLDPQHPNAYAPGKRPFHTIIPGFVMKDGAPLIAFGLMGGSMQAQGHAQVIVNMVDFGMDLQEAGDAARFRHDGSTEPGYPMTDGGKVILEPGVPAAVLESLRQRGHSVKLALGDYGGYEAVMRDPVTGVLTGATEKRKDGGAVGY